MSHMMQAEWLPAQLVASERGSFAEYTVRQRLPAQVLRVMADNDFSAEIKQALQAFHDDIPNGILRPLTDRRDKWDQLGVGFFGRNWLEAPWLFVEIYFYRRLLEATQFFSNGIDPFRKQKAQAWQAAAPTIERITAQLSQQSPSDLPQLLTQALWGNQADLGLFPIGSQQPATHQSARAAATLIDDTAAVVAYFEQHKPLKRVDIILDNAGLEFVGDLCLADFLLTHNYAVQIVLHCKATPFFTSDVIEADVAWTVATLAVHKNPATAQMGQRCQTYLADGRLQLQAEAYWTAGLGYRPMDTALSADLAQSDLLISKGDLNYRRWLGDRKWAYDTPFAKIVDYAPAPLLCLRTYKAPVACGLAAAVTDRLFARDPDWHISGRYGLIQFWAQKSIVGR
ncbi:MAG TPA: protein-glutamate O-methyltransferase family protein [Anaerolineae bacterium]|nr:protein-glutamate O-methyltransferase family protein [Anaerolineae bacterium]